MIARKDHCGGIGPECGLDHFPRINACLCQCSPEKLLDRYHAVLCIEQEHDKDLMREPCQAVLQKPADG